MTEEVTQGTPPADDPNVQNGASTPANDPAAQGGQQDPNGQQQPSGQDPQQQPGQQQEPAPKRVPWFERRIDEVTAARREAERERDALRALLEQRDPAQQQPGAQQPQPPAQPDPYKLAEEIAHRKALDEAANRTFEAGVSSHGEAFVTAVRTMQQVADISKQPDFLEAVTSLPNAADVYFHLGSNPDEAAHVLRLPPVKMAMELARLSAQIGKPKPASKASAPITPVGRGATPSSDLTDDMPIEEWMKRRQAQVDAR